MGDLYRISSYCMVYYSLHLDVIICESIMGHFGSEPNGSPGHSGHYLNMTQYSNAGLNNYKSADSYNMCIAKLSL